MFKSNAAERGIIAIHFSPGRQLRLTNIVSGDIYERPVVTNPEDFADCHIVGPGHRTHGSTIQADGGRQTTSFFRAQHFPFDSVNSTSSVAIELRAQFSLDPTEPLLRLSAWLNQRAVPHLVERSFRIGRWVIWIFLTRREHRDAVVPDVYRLYAEARDANVLDPAITSIPILEDGAEPPHIPLHFFGGSFFSQLYTFHHGTIRPANLRCVPHIDLRSGDIHLAFFGDDPEELAIKQLVEAWWSRFGSRKLRSGAIMEMIASSSISLTVIDEEPSDHSKTIALGRLFQRLDGQIIGGHRLHARRSGNSTVYWLTIA